MACVVLENCKNPKGNNNSNSSSSGRGNYKLLVNEAKRPQLVLQLMVKNVMNFDYAFSMASHHMIIMFFVGNIAVVFHISLVMTEEEKHACLGELLLSTCSVPL